MKTKIVRLASPPFPEKGFGWSGENKTVESNTVKYHYDKLMDTITNSTVYDNLTTEEVEKTSLIFDQHLALLTIGARLKQKRIQTEYNLSDWRRNVDNYANKILKDMNSNGGDILGFTSTTVDYPDVCKVAEKIKKEKPETVIVVGGCHPTFMSKRILRECNSFDYCAIGPSSSILEMLALGGDVSSAHGVAFRDNGDVKVNPPIKNGGENEYLNFPYPLPYDNALQARKKIPLARIYSRIGCDRGCFYCCDKIWKGNVSKVEYDNFEKELNYLYHKRGSRFFYIGDQDATFDMDHFRKVLKRLNKLKTYDDRVRFSTQNTAHSLQNATDEDLKDMDRAGIRWYQIGLESLDSSINCKTSTELLEKELRRIKKFSPESHISLYLLIGLPGDTYKKSLDTMRYVENLSREGLITMFRLSLFVPYPATAVYWNREKFNIKIDDSDWTRFGCFSFIPPNWEYTNYSAQDIFRTYYDTLELGCEILDDKITTLGIDRDKALPFSELV